MMAPYSYLSGAISLDFGGKQGSASASGIIDGTGYLGGVFAGNSNFGDVGMARCVCSAGQGCAAIFGGGGLPAKRS
jgi:hypothetical protein